MSFTHLLDKRPDPAVDVDKLREQAGIIQSVFMQFGIPATVTRIDSGPTLARFSVLPGDKERKRPQVDVENEAIQVLRTMGYGTAQKPISRAVLNNQISRVRQYERRRIRLREIESLENDVALQLNSYGVRIAAQTTSSGTVGVEVPHASRGTVGLRELIQSPVWKGAIPVPFGREAGGIAITHDLAAMPHLLVAGATGTGKSVFLNSLITSILVTRVSTDVRLAMVDMKGVELIQYAEVPHMMWSVATEAETAQKLLDKLILEMESRYNVFAKAGVRSIAEYRLSRKMPYIVLVMDELADLMEQDKKGTESRVLRLSQKSRATGIHIVMATQRPSVNIITGVIKANVPVKLAFTVSSQTDSRVIIGEKGAERLLSKGDALLQIPGKELVRVQAPLVTDDEIERVIAAVKG